jgi:hypothetical protein
VAGTESASNGVFSGQLVNPHLYAKPLTLGSGTWGCAVDAPPERVLASASTCGQKGKE